MGVSKNRGTPKSSILIRIFHYKPSILGGKTTPIFGNTQISLTSKESEHFQMTFDQVLMVNLCSKCRSSSNRPCMEPPDAKILLMVQKSCTSWQVGYTIIYKVLFGKFTVSLFGKFTR